MSFTVLLMVCMLLDDFKWFKLVLAGIKWILIVLFDVKWIWMVLNDLSVLMFLLILNDLKSCV